MISLEEAAEAPLEAVGGKARALGCALQQGLPVPRGVVVLPFEEPDGERLAGAIESGAYAVRSSSPAEDGSDRSWAGQFTSLLPVQPDSLDAAIREVRASGASERARAYGSSGETIPVLVQAVVPALSAGVAFSLDPVNGDEHHCIVEAVDGLATEMAEGAATPRRWRVEVETGRHDHPADGPLDADALAKVVELVLRVADWLGRPSDVEWAWDGDRVWLIQARPVTAANWRPAEGQWTTANVGETMPGIVSPLASSVILEDEFARLIDASLHKLGIASEDEVIVEGRRFYGHAYWRVDRIKERMLQLPGFVERKADESMGIARTYEGDGRRSSLTPRTIVNAIPAGRALWTMYRREGPRAQRFARELDRAEPGWLSLRWERLVDADVIERLAAARALHREANYHAITVNFLAEQAQDFVRELLDTVGSTLDPQPDARLLLAGVGTVPTAAATTELEELARRHIGGAAAITAVDTVNELPPEVAADFQAVVERFGWMAAADDELSLPRWDEDAALPLALFKAAVHAEQVATGTGTRDFAARRLREEQRVFASTRFARPVLRRALGLARRYQTLREELRVTVARANRILRRAFVAVGERYAAGGQIADPAEVFWLTVEECTRLLDGRLESRDARDAIGARRRHGRRFRNWDPPRLLGGEPLRDGHDSTSAAAELSGVPCSWGVARGPVTVLHRLEDIAAVKPGAVLVLRHANPGWTPAFVVAIALVTEEGGLLSHSAVIARERGLPTVINVPKATERLRDGQVVEVDGGRGSVTVVGDFEAP